MGGTGAAAELAAGSEVQSGERRSRPAHRRRFSVAGTGHSAKATVRYGGLLV